MSKAYPHFLPSYSHQELVEHFLLTPAELHFVLAFRGEANRCGVALPKVEHLRTVTAGLDARGVDRHGRIRNTRLTAQSVALVVKKLTTKAGIPGDYAGHSLRAGLPTAAAAAGVPERAIMAQTGHRSLATLRKYIRQGSLFLENAAAKVGL